MREESQEKAQEKEGEKEGLTGWGQSGYTFPMKRVELKIRMDPKLKARLKVEARIASAIFNRKVNLNEFVTCLLDAPRKKEKQP